MNGDRLVSIIYPDSAHRNPHTLSKQCGKNVPYFYFTESEEGFGQLALDNNMR